MLRQNAISEGAEHVMSSFLDELERVGLVDGLGPELGQGADHHPRLEVLLSILPNY